MPEYIEREVGDNSLCEVVRKYNRKKMGNEAVGAFEALDRFRRLPAADARPVVRGHWITEEEAEEKGDYTLRDACSVCGHCDWDCTESASFNFCPNCGADMRENDNG